MNIEFAFSVLFLLCVNSVVCRLIQKASMLLPHNDTADLMFTVMEVSNVCHFHIVFK